MSDSRNDRAGSEVANRTRTKHEIRSRVRESRRARTPHDIASLGESLTPRLIHAIAMASEQSPITSIACYLPVRGEPNTVPFLEWAIATGFEVLVPVSRPDGLLDWAQLTEVPPQSGETEATQIRGSPQAPLRAAFTAGSFGITEPTGLSLPPDTVGTVDLIFAPACAADRRGVRLGWGRGFYDRTLAQLTQRPPIVAVVYESDLFDELPHEPHDVLMNGVVTPQQMLWCSRSS